jgi:enoyl-[acyl-carrier-protein] reductase (NADH)
MFSLAKKVGLVVGIANEQSIAWGCAKAFRGAGADIAVTPTHQLSTIEDVGAHAVFLVSDGARTVTGGVHHFDGGYSITG